MLTPAPVAPPRHDHRISSGARMDSMNLVAISSERNHEANKQPAPAVSFRLRGFGRRATPRAVQPGRRRDPRRFRGLDASAEGHGRGPESVSRWPGRGAGWCGSSAAEHRRDPGVAPARRRHGPDHESIAAAIIAVAVPTPCLPGRSRPTTPIRPEWFAHLADLASRAYRALRPPRELVVHPGFAQVARRFQFIQMSHHEARGLAGGAIDIGILAQRLRQLQGDRGEFAITHFSGHGLLWADGALVGDRPDQRRERRRGSGGRCVQRGLGRGTAVPADLRLAGPFVRTIGRCQFHPQESTGGLTMRRSLAVTMRLAVLVLSMGLDPRVALAAESELQAIRVLKDQGLERQDKSASIWVLSREEEAIRRYGNAKYLERSSGRDSGRDAAARHGRSEPTGHDQLSTRIKLLCARPGSPRSTRSLHL